MVMADQRLPDISVLATEQPATFVSNTTGREDVPTMDSSLPEIRDKPDEVKAEFVVDSHTPECGSSGKTTVLTCGGCCSSFTTICQLHAHLKIHGSGGSYYFNNETKIAYPKFDVVCSAVQTLDSIFEEETVIDKTSVTEEVKPPEPEVKKIRGRKRKAEQPIQENAKKARQTRGKDNSTKSKLPVITEKPTKPVIKTNNVPAKRKSSKSLAKHDKQDKINHVEENKDDIVDKPEKPTVNKKLKEKKKGKKEKSNKEQKDTEESKEQEEPEKQEAEQNDCKETVKDEVVKLSNDEQTPICTDDTLNAPESKTEKSDFEAAEKQDVHNELNEGGPVHSDGEDTETDSVQLECAGLPADEPIKRAVKKITKKKETKEEKEARLKAKALKEPKERKKKEKKEKEDLYQSCEKCNEIILQKKMKAHMITHTGEKSFICEICGQAYAKNSNLYRHKITHREVKPFRCSFCPAQFCRKKDYTYHINSHKGYRPHVCNVCDKRFLTNKGLIQHQENIHMGITKFQCDFCDRRFFKKSGLYAHRATHFEATLECQYCDRKFRDKCGLNKHERTHTGKKHYQCHICEHAFNQCTPYYQHMEKRHNMDRGSIKDIMKIVMEAKKRDGGQKVDLFRVPNNIEEIITNLRLEEENKVSFKCEPMRSFNGDMKPEDNAVADGKYTVSETLYPQPSSGFVNHTISENSFVHTAPDAMVNVSVADNSSVALTMPTLEPMKPVALLLKTEDEMKPLYHGYVEMQHQPQPIQPTQNVLSFSVTDQTGASSGLMNLEPVKTFLHAGGHPKQKMKLLSQYAEYQQQKTNMGQTGQLLQAKVEGVPITASLPAYSHTTVHAGSMEPLTDAYTTSDILDSFFQGQ